MDYEKKYKEALERARALRNEAIEKEYVDDYIKDYETIFPELRESEDEKVRKCLIAMVNATIWDSSNLASKKACLAWLEKQKEQKPAGWSKEDENKIERLAFLVSVAEEKEMISPSESVDLRNFIKSLRPQPKQEWSEEDEKHINLILRVLDIQQCWDGATGKKFNPYQGEIDWLKSLRPSWKPSEEQMSMLRAVINDPNNSGAESCQIALRGIYEQLKKL